MKCKMIALLLALTVMSWAQTTTQTTPSAPQQSTVPADKAKCPCCDKMAATDAKSGPSCCAHHGKHAKQGKEMAGCCAGKEAMSCMKNDKDKTGTSCCGDSCGKDKTASMCGADKCGKECDKGCCSSKKTEKTAKTCCGEELRG